MNKLAAMDLRKTMVCPHCGTTVAVTDQFCSKCFERLERPSLWKRLRAWFQTAFKSVPHTFVNKPASHTLVLKKDVRLETTDKQNVRHIYHSLDEMPPDLRGEFEKLESEAKQLNSEAPSAAVPREPLKQEFIVRKKIEVFKFKDASGKEQIYRSLDEMPPETRELFEKLRGRLDFPGAT